MLNIDYNWGELNVFSRTSYDVEDCIQPLMAMSKCAAPEIEPVDIDVTDTVAFTWEIQCFFDFFEIRYSTNALFVSVVK